MGQAKNYAGKLAVRHAYATNGRGIYAIDMVTGKEGEIPKYPTPDELWAMTFPKPDAWRDRFAAIPFEDKGGTHPSRYYQDTAIDRVMAAIACGVMANIIGQAYADSILDNQATAGAVAKPNRKLIEFNESIYRVLENTVGNTTPTTIPRLVGSVAQAQCAEPR